MKQVLWVIIFCINSLVQIAGQSTIHNFSLSADTVLYPDKYILMIYIETNPNACDPDFGYVNLDMKVAQLKKSFVQYNLDTILMKEKFFKDQHNTILYFMAKTQNQINLMNKVCKINNISRTELLYFYKIDIKTIDSKLIDKTLAKFYLINNKLFENKPYHIQSIEIETNDYSWLETVGEESIIDINYFISETEEVFIATDINITIIN